MKANPASGPKSDERAFAQLSFLLYEIGIIVNKRYWRWLSVWFGNCVWINVSYRLDRFLFLLAGRVYPVIRPLFLPLFLVFGFLGGRHEIHYRARIGPGLAILHTALGIVISAKTVAGARLPLVGGNLIGGRKPIEEGDILIGSGVQLGAHAVVLGPVKVGDHAQVGAGAVVVSDVPAGAVVVGVPAREVRGSQGL